MSQQNTLEIQRMTKLLEKMLSETLQNWLCFWWITQRSSTTSQCPIDIIKALLETIIKKFEEHRHSSSLQTTEGSSVNTTPAAPATTTPAAGQSSYNHNQHFQQMQQHPLHQHHSSRQMYNRMHSDYPSMCMKNPVAGRAEVQPNASTYHMPYASYQMDRVSQMMPQMHALQEAVPGHHQQQQTTHCREHHQVFNNMQQNYTQNVPSNPNAATVNSSNSNNRENLQAALNPNLRELLTASLNYQENAINIRTIYEDLLRIQQPAHLELSRPHPSPPPQQQQPQSQHIPTTRGQKRKATTETFVSSIPKKMELQQHRHQEQQRNDNRLTPLSVQQPQKSSVSDDSETEPPTMVPRFEPNFTIGPQQQPASTESNSKDMTTHNFRL